MMNMKNAVLLYSDETYAINRCIYDVFDSLPRYAEESLYQEALEIALADANIPFESQKEIAPTFHGRMLTHTYRPDIICYGKIVVELKAVKRLAPEHFAQLRNYLGLLDMRVCLLVNFHGYPNVEIRRVFLDNQDREGKVEDVETGEITPIHLH
jgi:GxxExxY protein